jgi:hypothetical protein
MFTLLAASLFGCGRKNDESANGTDSGTKDELAGLQTEYSILKAELELAKTDSVYLVIDIPGKRFVLKQRGTVLWDQPVEELQSSDGRWLFGNEFTGGGSHFVRRVEDVHLYAFTEQSPDSVLKIVSETVRTTVDRMQRVVPERFDITWQDDLILEIVTEIKGRPESKFSNLMTSIRRNFQRQGRGARLVVGMDAKRSVTFYRVAVKGLPTLVIPG